MTSIKEQKVHLLNFRANTNKRISQIEAKGKSATRAEIFELEACRFDLKRVDAELKRIDEAEKTRA